MKFHLGPVPETPDFHPEATGWTALREPNPVLMQLLAAPIGVVSAIVVGVLWHLGVPLWLRGRDPAFEAIATLCVVVFLIPVHELLHAAAHPHRGRTNSTVIGCWPAKLICYAHYVLPLKRGHFLMVSLAPLLVLSALPLLVCVLFRWNMPSLAFLSVFNALVSCGDLLGVGLVLAQVPRAAWICNQGYYTWWKEKAEADAQL